VAHVLLAFAGVRKESPAIVRELALQEGEALVSCYVPFTRTGKEVRQNGIHLKNCQRALGAARERGEIGERTASAVARELARAAETAVNPRAPRKAGLALFAAGDECVALEPPAPFGALITVAPRYYVVPLLPLTATLPPVLVLALSRHAVRLIDHASAHEVSLPPDVPRSLTDVVGNELRTPSMHQHSVGNGAVYHGHGEGEDDLLPEIEVYCRRIASALEGELNRDGATVVLAGDVQITAVFRRAASGWPLLDEQINGNHDRTAAADLSALATPLACAQQSARHAHLKTLFGARSAEQRASDDPADIAAAARDGRIDTLLLEHAAALDAPRLRAARARHAVQPEGPFNREVVQTLRCGGDVHVLAAAHMPTSAPQAAIFRF
jgi:hypothetical protein